MPKDGSFQRLSPALLYDHDCTSNRLSWLREQHLQYDEIKKESREQGHIQDRKLML